MQNKESIASTGVAYKRAERREQKREIIETRAKRKHKKE